MGVMFTRATSDLVENFEQAAADAAALEDDITITDCRIADLGAVSATVEIENTLDRLIQNVSVTVDFFDDEGFVVTSAMADFSNLAVGETGVRAAQGFVSGEAPESVRCEVSDVLVEPIFGVPTSPTTR